jgi:hypothetical protein
MNKHKWIIFLKLLVVVFILFIIIIFLITRLLIIKLPLRYKGTFNETLVALNWDNDRNFIQTGSSCAGFASMAFLYSLKGIKLNPYAIYINLNKRVKDNTVYPWEISRYLRIFGIETVTYSLSLMPLEEREDWIKDKMNKKTPVILEINNGNKLHYIAILGYNSNNFYVYDSLVKTDTNGVEPGVISINCKQLMSRWQNTKYFGIPINIAITL